MVLEKLFNQIARCDVDGKINVLRWIALLSSQFHLKFKDKRKENSTNETYLMFQLYV